MTVDFAVPPTHVQLVPEEGRVEETAALTYTWLRFTLRQ